MIIIYDKTHNKIDEISEYSSLETTWTLNGYGKSGFKISASSSKATAENLQFLNHVEIYKGGVLQWGGVIVNRTFQGADINIQCYGYMWLLSKHRMRAKTYAEMTYGNLITTVLAEVNAVADSGIILGAIEAGSLKTQRLVTNTDIVIEKLLSWVDDGNYNIEVDKDRNLNFFLRKGSLKENYLIEYGNLDGDNVINAPDLGQSAIDMANDIYSQTDTVNQNYSDAISKGLYGLLEATFSASGSIVEQTTLNAYVAGELQRRAYPLYSVNVQITDSDQCPFSDFNVGDTIPVSLVPYWGFKENMRVLEIKESTITDPNGSTTKDIRDLVLGSIIYRQSTINKKLYKG